MTVLYVDLTAMAEEWAHYKEQSIKLSTMIHMHAHARPHNTQWSPHHLFYWLVLLLVDWWRCVLTRKRAHTHEGPWHLTDCDRLPHRKMAAATQKCTAIHNNSHADDDDDVEDVDDEADGCLDFKEMNPSKDVIYSEEVFVC